MNIDDFITSLDSMLIDDIPVLESNVRFMNDSKLRFGNLYPVYIVLFSGMKDTISRIIRRITSSEFSHASLTFDLSMKHLYSFGRTGDGLRIESFSNMENVDTKDNKERYYSSELGYRLYVTFVPKEDYKLIQDKMKWFIDNIDKSRFSYEGLIYTAMGIKHEDPRKYFCSQFITHVLNAGNNQIIDKEPSLVKPYNFTEFPNFYRVCGGYIGSYNQRAAEKSVKAIYNRVIKKKK